jgi:hypothetical protein
MEAAEELLRLASVVSLDEERAQNLTGEPTTTASGTPYLVRGVGAARGRLPLSVSVRPTGEIWVGGEAISPICPVPRERRPIVVWLERQPGEVFVTFSVSR